MTKYSKQYDALSRSAMQYPSPARSRFLKLLAATIVTVLTLTALRSLYTTSNYSYGLMIDAGSTGSRIHTFTFRKDPATSKLHVIHEDFYAIKPGLSHYKQNPQNAAKSLQKLITRAKSQVPHAAHLHTPIVLRATAGLRLVGEQTADQILHHVRTFLKQSGFRFDDSSWASILSGNEEGMYSWTTVNFLLDRDPLFTVGTLEMGGGSSQVAYVPRDNILNSAKPNCSTDSEKLNFKGKKLDLYTKSHLQFGLQKARELALRKFQEKSLLNDNPCINAGTPIDVPIPFEKDTTLKMSGKGNFNACRKLLADELITPVTSVCKCDLCTYNGAAQPPPIPEYVALAFYRERTVELGLSTPMTVKDIRKLGEEVCNMTVEQVKEKFPTVSNGVATDLCLDLSYIVVHLKHGHGITEESGASLMAMEKINGFELGWCLGAMQQIMSTLKDVSV